MCVCVGGGGYGRVIIFVSGREGGGMAVGYMLGLINKV